MKLQGTDANNKNLNCHGRSSINQNIQASKMRDERLNSFQLVYGEAFVNSSKRLRDEVAVETKGRGLDMKNATTDMVMCTIRWTSRFTMRPASLCTSLRGIFATLSALNASRLTIVLECFHLVSFSRIRSRLIQENMFLQQQASESTFSWKSFGDTAMMVNEKPPWTWYTKKEKNKCMVSHIQAALRFTLTSVSEIGKWPLARSRI